MTRWPPQATRSSKRRAQPQEREVQLALRCRRLAEAPQLTVGTKTDEDHPDLDAGSGEFADGDRREPRVDLRVWAWRS